jgi:carbamate kinase
VEAVLRFVRGGGTRGVITALDLIAEAVDGSAGTVVQNSSVPMER